MPGLRIGDLAERAGTNAPTIRYYEQIGLLPPPERQAGNQRRYAESDIARLNFIRRCRDFGFSIDQVRKLSSILQDPSCSCFEARDVAAAHLEEIRVKLRELRALEDAVASFVATCDAQCAGGPGPDCAIFEDLGATDKARAKIRARR